MNEDRKPLRCAIYTRKSTEEGLEQEFNTLQAQRESAEAYIRSQQFSGWIPLPDNYDDGGFSGASLERPALERLLHAVEAGTIDCVVVYKVDRLSRSLFDFARLMSLFDRHGVSFVSVTQEFNTTTSLGRLTLNILLSFAQFERELISERTRDKLSAARKKGKWIGGVPVLGYDIDPAGGRLIVNKREADRVREIFAVCEEAGTLAAGLREVNRRGLLTKTWTTKNGRQYIGKPFQAHTLGALLSNVLYKGSVQHKGTVYAGEQKTIMDSTVWEKVNRKLALAGAKQRGLHHGNQQALLLKLARCGECGAELGINFTRRKQQRYRYYTCPESKKRQGCKQRPIAVQDLDNAVLRRVEEVLARQVSSVTLHQLVERVVFASRTRELIIWLEDGTRITAEVAFPNRPGVRGSQNALGRVPRISKLLALAIKMRDQLADGKVADFTEMATVRHISKPRLSQILSLTNLAPEIQEALLFLPKNHRGPDPITETAVRPIAAQVDWTLQKQLFGKLVNRAQN